MTIHLIIFAPIRLTPAAGISARTSLRSKWSSVSRDDTNNRHQPAWTLLYSDGRQIACRACRAEDPPRRGELIAK
jgi:hypothetical protein